MQRLTQTVTASAANSWRGNCWQTCCAMLLDVDVDALPPQADYDGNETTPEGLMGERIVGPYYQGALERYLWTHHKLQWVQLHLDADRLPQLRTAGLHAICGETVRTAATGGRMRHVVIGRDGEVEWDPHPSRAGLLLPRRNWAFLTSWDPTRDPPSALCPCPKCGGPLEPPRKPCECAECAAKRATATETTT